MENQTKTQSGCLANAFTSHIWDSRIKSANTTKKEMWLGYFLGVWGMMMTSSIVNSYFNQYLTDVLGFTASKGAWIAGFMVLFPVISKLIDAITNLVMAKIIDSTTCKQGKVRPWLLISAPFVLVSVILLFWMPFQNVTAQAIWIVVMFNLYYSVSFTMWNMSKELMPAVSTRNVNQRKNLATAAQIVGNVGTGIVSILFPTILAAVCGMVHGDNAKGYLISMTVIATLAVVTTFVQYFYTRERVTEERRNQSGIAKVEAKRLEVHKEASMMEQFRACLKSKYWILFVLIVLIFNICSNLRNISLIYYSGWVVRGNAYGEVAAIQAKFQMIALSPMGPGILLMLPLTKKFGRTKTIWITAVLTIAGSIWAYLSMGKGVMIYAGTALAAIGNISFSYMLMTFMGDIIDQVEWKTGVRADGLTGGFISAMMMFAVGIAQGLFNLGLMVTGYTQPQQIGMVGDIAQYADQTAAAVNWINFAYQGSYIIIGIVVFSMFCFVFKMEDDMPRISKELQERKVAECAKLGIEYIPADELERREIARQEAKAEEIRIKELKERCAKKGLDFGKENQKFLDKRAAKAERKAEKKRKRNWKKTLLIVLIVVIALTAAQLYILGARGGIGPLKFLRKDSMAKAAGNAEQYHLENVEPLSDSSLSGMRIGFLGSSVTKGYASLDVSMADYIGKRNNCEIVKEAVNGTTLTDNGSDSYVSRLKANIDSNQQFDLFVVQLSTNDASKNCTLGAISDSTDKDSFDTKTIIGAMEYIIAYVQETWDCPVVFYTNIQYGSTLYRDSDLYQQMVDAVLALQDKWGIGVIDLWNDPNVNAVSEEDYKLYMYDDIHPTQAGYLEWWVPAMEAYLYDFVK